MDCGDPGYLPNTARTGGQFTYGHTVEYDCESGFHLEDRNFGSTRFTLTCQANGEWTKGTTCVGKFF